MEFNIKNINSFESVLFYMHLIRCNKIFFSHSETNISKTSGNEYKIYYVYLLTNNSYISTRIWGSDLLDKLSSVYERVEIPKDLPEKIFYNIEDLKTWNKKGKVLKKTEKTIKFSVPWNKCDIEITAYDKDKKYIDKLNINDEIVFADYLC